jgi:hypothetical protein
MRFLYLALLVAIVLLPLAGTTADTPKEAKPFKGRISHDPVLVVKPGKGTLLLTVKYPKGYHYTTEAPTSFEWRSSDGKVLKFSKEASQYTFTKIVFPISIPIQAVKGQTEISIDGALFFCHDKTGVCLFDTVRLIVPIKVDPSGSSKPQLTIDAVAPGGKEDL